MQTVVKDKIVSTIPASRGGFKTILFDKNQKQLASWHYSTYKAAIANHEKIVKTINTQSSDIYDG